MEGSGFGFPLGGDPEDLMRSLREFAEQQAESVQEAQREQFATLTLNTAVELTAAALQQVNASGGADEQAVALRDAMRVLFPEAVALVSAARQGFYARGLNVGTTSARRRAASRFGSASRRASVGAGFPESALRCAAVRSGRSRSGCGSRDRTSGSSRSQVSLRRDTMLDTKTLDVKKLLLNNPG